MKSLKQIINRYIRSAAIVMALVILVVIAFAEILIEQGRVEDTAAGTFVRLEQIIKARQAAEKERIKQKITEINRTNGFLGDFFAELTAYSVNARVSQASAMSKAR